MQERFIEIQTDDNLIIRAASPASAHTATVGEIKFSLAFVPKRWS